MSRSFEFDPVSAISIGTEGTPGQRQFFLHIQGSDQSAILDCEKVHVQGLIARIVQLLEAQGLEAGLEGEAPPPAQYGRPEWNVGEMGLGYHDARELFVLMARELATEPGQDAADLATARCWLGAEQILRLARQAMVVVTSGRPTCPRCGLPMDPSGHPCPAANGARLIV